MNSLVPDDKEHRLRTLVLLLSSDKDGEVVAAARAIGKMLTAHGKNWHDLAAIVPGRSVEAPKPTKATKSSDGVKVKKFTVKDGTFINLMKASLTEWESEFVRSVHDQYKRRGNLTEKQADVLRGILDRVKKAGKSSGPC